MGLNTAWKSFLKVCDTCKHLWLDEIESPSSPAIGTSPFRRIALSSCEIVSIYTVATMSGHIFRVILRLPSGDLRSDIALEDIRLQG